MSSIEFSKQSQTETLEKIPDAASLTQQLAAEASKPALNPELEKQADAVVSQLIELDPAVFAKSQDAKSAVETMGADAQRESAQISEILRAPVGIMAKRSDEGGEVSNALVDLKMKVEELDPAQIDFSPGWFSRLFGFIPGIGKPIKRYFTKFESSQTVIEAIKNSLVKGQDQLRRDNVTLLADQKRMRDATTKLKKAIELGQAIDKKLAEKIMAIPASDPRYKFLSEEILFALRQRIQDLQQQLVVNQQGIVAIEIIIRNNKELIRGVDRTVKVTVNALSVGATLAIALADQKVVLDKVNAVTDTTNKLIANTARMLKEQGTEIHKQAASTALDMNVLKQAFSDIRAALDDISRFRSDALPKMAQAVVELNDMTAQQDETIQQLEDGNKFSNTFHVKL